MLRFQSSDKFQANNNELAQERRNQLNHRQPSLCARCPAAIGDLVSAVVPVNEPAVPGLIRSQRPCHVSHQLFALIHLVLIPELQDSRKRHISDYA